MFDRFFKSQHPDPAPVGPPVPRLYPDIEAPHFALFSNPMVSQKIKKYPLVMVLPFIDQPFSQDDMLFGAGFSRLLIRNLMLVRNISVKGPEDTPDVGLEEFRKHVTEARREILIGGRITRDSQNFSVQIGFLTPKGKFVTKTVSAPDGRTLLWQATELIVKMVRGEVDDEIREMWRYGQPLQDYEANVLRLGHLRIGFQRSDPAQTQQAWQLFQQVPTMGSICSYLDDDHLPTAKYVYLDAYQQDPYDAQLCFSLFIGFWESKGHEPLALQFIRRGLELSPAHGKLNMCAPHAVHPDVKRQMLHHSELGYRLLPGNSFAINNYLLNLSYSDAPVAAILAFAKEAEKADPYDPGAREKIQEILTKSGMYREALQIAIRLEQLYRVMHPRTLYCIQQNPQRHQLLQMGYDFADAKRREIQDLQSKIQRQG